MAQPLIRRFLIDVMRVLELPAPVVEFGSLQVEPGQEGDLRSLFPGRSFTGTDMRPGPGVDRVEDLRALGYGDGTVGTALCLDTLEHCDDPPQAGRELARVVARDGGVCVVSSVMLFGIHGYPSDYFRFTPEGMRAVLSGFDSAWVCGLGHPDMPIQVVGVAAHGRELDLSLEDLPSLAKAQQLFDEHPGQVRLGALNHRRGDVVRALLRSLRPR